MTLQIPNKTTLRELKGAPLSCLIALLIAGGPMTKLELADETGWDHQSIAKAMRFLCGRGLALALPNSREPTWQLATAANQLPLTWNMFTSEISESRGGGSSYVNNNDSQYLIPLPPQAAIQKIYDATTTYPHSPQTYPQFFPHAPSSTADAAIALLIAPLKDLGCPEGKAIAAVTRALHRGETAQAIAEKIVTGRAHLQSPGARGIRLPGQWLAACIADGRAIVTPPGAHDAERDYRDYLEYAANAPDAGLETPEPVGGPSAGSGQALTPTDDPPPPA